jgi:hypothetical protein
MAEHLPVRRFLRKAQAKLMFGDPPDSTWYRWIEESLIPEPIKLRSVRLSVSWWAEDELIAAQQRLIAQRDQRLAERQRAAAGAALAEAVEVEPVAEAPEAPAQESHRKPSGRRRGRPRKAKAGNPEASEFAPV